jgi:hypothetical protein
MKLRRSTAPRHKVVAQHGEVNARFRAAMAVELCNMREAASKA